MSTGAIIAIVAGVIILLVVLFAVLAPRMRARKHERQLETRRTELASQHRDEAAEQAARAREAQSAAKKAEAEAEMHEARAELHEKGLADDEIVGDRDRDGRTDDATAGDDRPLRRA